jgi:MoaA/NifB/PqqE/SkfB family radical SAM enzyme
VLLWDRLKVMLKAGFCHETWRLSFRQRQALTKMLWATRPATAETGTFLCVYWPPVGSVAFRRHLDGIRSMATGQYVPLVVHVSVTDRCPCSCARCSNLSCGQPDPQLERVSSLLADLKRAGTVSVAFTGGEPLLRSDLSEMIRFCEPEMSTVLFTTGLGLDSMRAGALRRAGLSAAFVSLDHHDASRHNQIRNHSDAFEAAVQAVCLFREQGIYTAVQAVVSPDLLDEQNMQSFLRFCKSLAVHEVMLLEPVPVGGKNRGCSALSKDGRHYLRTLHRRAAGDASLQKINAMSFLEGSDLLGCQAGCSFVYVTTGGDVYPCDFVPLSLGNTYEIGLKAVMDRLAACFAGPSCECLASQLDDLMGYAVTSPVTWDEGRRVLASRPHCAPPYLTRLFFA